ncbi:Asp23/Gls24 family envelope stress response protein [Paeniglutamicibacter kerguelensis]|uniref:Alkaline shock family protein YloU n=1 Tax=Paeniglutamicibacter kerguelensis TaxID=254788 RepID=A0ABS4XE94_9MICC|nr:Asp23/Gls24 family envelope stress response protein [Paeniglutamicibacter kerguelensis]MBP2385989.1 putative alkaline shock family protein YloU [Paeniglutamicibacter kerguelensis]
MAVEEAPRLGCRRSIDRIWATIGLPPTPHEKTCELCQSARARLEELSEATRSLRENDLHNPAMKPRLGITKAIMDVARAEVRRIARILLHTSREGNTEVSEQALASVIRIAAAEIPGVHARRCHIDIRPANNDPSCDIASPGSTGTAHHPGPHLIVTLRVAAATGINIPRTVDALRQRIGTAIPACVGIGTGTINITVEDLYDV